MKIINCSIFIAMRKGLTIFARFNIAPNNLKF